MRTKLGDQLYKHQSLFCIPNFVEQLLRFSVLISAERKALNRRVGYRYPLRQVKNGLHSFMSTLVFASAHGT